MAWRTLDGGAPRVIAHRGASGARPEHTLAGYALALGQGADLVEPDLVTSADGVLFARHDAGLARSTDVGSRAEFAARAQDGDWPCDRFGAAEIDSLRAIQPMPGRDKRFDREWAPPRWRAVLDWAQAAARERGAPVRLYPELKHPAFFAGRGNDTVAAFIDSMSPPRDGVEVWVQCFEAEPLRRVHEATGLRCCLGIARDADWRAAIRTRGAWLAGFVADKRLLRDARGEDSGLVAAAHAAGLRVDAWTFRDDQPGTDGIEAELAAAMRLGVDALFCDFPDTALRVRAALGAALS
jgi:glycerophosphoryl diester phosphodiesterase